MAATKFLNDTGLNQLITLIKGQFKEIEDNYVENIDLESTLEGYVDNTTLNNLKKDLVVNIKPGTVNASAKTVQLDVDYAATGGTGNKTVTLDLSTMFAAFSTTDRFLTGATYNDGKIVFTFNVASGSTPKEETVEVDVKDLIDIYKFKNANTDWFYVTETKGSDGATEWTITAGTKMTNLETKVNGLPDKEYVDGKVKSAIEDLGDLPSADDLAQLQSQLDTVKNATDKIETNERNIGNLTTRVEALETKVGDGFEPVDVQTAWRTVFGS